MSNPAPTLNQINAFNATQGTTIDFNIIGGTEVIRSNKIYIYDLSDNSLICTHLYVSTESIHELPPNTSSSIVYEDGKTSADFTNNTQYYAQIQTFTDVGGTQGGSGLSIAKLFWCLPTPTLTLSTIPTTISTTSYNVSATYTPNTSGSATNEIQEFQFNLYSAIGALLQTSGVVLYGEGVDLSYNFSGLEVDSTYYVTLDVTTTQGMNVSAQSNTFTVSIDTPTIGSASVVNNGCDGYISVTSSLSSEYEHEESSEAGEIMSFTTDSVNDIIELDVDFEPVQDGTPWMSAQNTEPYMFRAVPSQTEDFGHESDCIVGGTVGWNQLAESLTADSWQLNSNAYGTLSFSEGVATFSVTIKSNGLIQKVGHRPLFIDGHKYLCWCDIKLTTATNLVRVDFNSRTFDTIASTSWQSRYLLFDGVSTYHQYVAVLDRRESDWDDIQVKNITVIDLTKMFGSTIANYIYSLEQANTGAGVAWFRKLFPNDYYPYDAGSLVSVSGLTSHDMVGFNQWDEQWELGQYNTSTGAPLPNNSCIRTKNAILVKPNCQYYTTYSSGNFEAFYYTIDDDYIGNSWVANGTFTTPPNCGLLRFRLSSNYGTTYNHDICINLSDASLNGTYKPYVKHSYPLDSDIVLRGIPKLDASNNLYYDGDIYESDGTVTRKYGAYTFDGTETWVAQSATAYIWSGISSDIKKPSDDNSYTNMLISGLSKSTRNAISYGAVTGDYIGVSTGGYIYITKEVYDSLSTKINGKKLVYELATSTTETADPYTNPQIVDPSGTEEYVGSPIPVGHKTTYQRICPITGWTGCEVDVSGVNVWDEEWERGYIVGGVEYASDGCIRSKNYNPCVGGETYYLYCGSATNQYFCRPIFYDAEKNFVSNGAWCANGTITAPSNARYFRLTTQSASSSYYGGTYKNDISFNFPSTDHNYHAYQGTTYISTFPKYKQQVSQDKTPYITKNIGDTYADTLTENLVGGTIAWNQSVPDTTTTHTVSGSIASMDDAVAGNFESVVCEINPIQDLHGYDKPWVGGSGKNKFNPQPYTGIGYNANIGATVTLTEASATFENNTISYTIEAWYNRVFRTPKLSQGSYKISMTNIVITSPRVSVYEVNGTDNTIIGKSNYSELPTDWEPVFSITESGNYFVLVIGSNTAQTLSFSYPQIEAGSTKTTYSPYENLCPITGWTGCEVDVSGVNLFGGAVENLAFGTYSIGDFIISGSSYRGIYAKVKGGSTYTVSRKTIEGNRFRIAATIGEPSNNVPCLPLRNAAGYDSDYSGTVTVPEGYNYIFVYLSNQSDACTASNYQIELGSTTTDYTPYNGTTYPVSWQTEAGTVYGGTMDVVSGVLTVNMKYDQMTYAYLSSLTSSYIDFSSNITQVGGNAVWVRNWNYTDYPATIDGGIKANCNAFPVSMHNKNIFSSQYRIYFGVGSMTTVEEFLSAVQALETEGGGLWIAHELQTPQTYQLDPTQVACLLGQNNVWADCGDTSVTYPTNHSYQSLSTTHKYYKRINGVESISVGSDVVANVGTDNIIDLTQMFGTTIADYIYNREQSSSSGMGVKFFKSLFPNDDYDYNSGELISVKASAHVIKDANGNVLHTYPLDSDLVLRGIPKLDANNKLYYDGDVYASSGNVTRKYGIVDLGSLGWSYSSSYGGFFHASLPNNQWGKYHYGTYQCGLCSRYIFYGTNTSGSDISDYPDKVITLRTDDSTTGQSRRVFVKDLSYSNETTFKSAMNGVYFVYELATSTTETADPFEENQTIIPNGIEEYTVTEQGDVEMPVGHDSTYYATEVYGGTIDMASGVLTIDNKVVDLGSLTWTKVSNNNYANFYTSDLASDIVYNATTPTVMCSQYKPEANNTALASDDGYIWVNAQKTVRIKDTSKANMTIDQFKAAMDGVQLVYELATPIEISLTPQQMQTLSGQNNIWSNTNGGMSLIYQLPITSLLVKRRDVADVSGKWLTLYSVPITQASDMDFTFIDFLNQYGKKYQYALVPVLAQDQSGVIVQIEGGYTVSDNVDSIFDGVYIADQTNVERVKAGVGYGNIDMNQGVGSITPIGSKYPIVITNSQNQYHNGSIRGTIVPNDFYSNGNLSRIDMVNKRDELEQFLTNKRAKIIKDWNGKIWLVMIMSNVSCSFDDNYGMGMVSFSADWLEVGDPTNQQDLYNAGLINVGGV